MPLPVVFTVQSYTFVSIYATFLWYFYLITLLLSACFIHKSDIGLCFPKSVLCGVLNCNAL